MIAENNGDRKQLKKKQKSIKQMKYNIHSLLKKIEFYINNNNN